MSKESAMLMFVLALALLLVWLGVRYWKSWGQTRTGHRPVKLEEPE